jgi:hypothetical protein
VELRARLILALLILLTAIACREAPVLPEAKEAKELEQRLWEAGASIFIPEDYELFRSSLRIARIHEIQERGRFPLWRKMERSREEYRELLNRGEHLLLLIEEKKNNQRTSLISEVEKLEGFLERMRLISSVINESQTIRERVTRAELLLVETRRLIEKDSFREAEKTIFSARQLGSSVRQIILDLFKRYLDEGYLSLWQKMAEETIAESRKRNSLAIVVDKLEKKLFVYSGGIRKAIYEVGLGRFSLADKIHAGDEATPEGKYKIIKKILNSKYYKALLLDYPNEDDRRRFAEMKKKGLIPPQVGIGGLIEIHGGGQDGLTYGCIALENEAMDELFRLVEVGTPVTIVGTFNRESPVLKLVREL